jgi:hypothetical protein
MYRLCLSVRTRRAGAEVGVGVGTAVGGRVEVAVGAGVVSCVGAHAAIIVAVRTDITRHLAR